MKRTIRWGPARQILLLAPAMAVAQAQQPGSSKERAPPAGKVTQDTGEEDALERIPGEVTDVVIEKKRGKNV
jgi:hypothetical protein